MSSSSEWKALIALALPLAAQQLGFQLMGAVDAALLGHYSDAALGGAALGNNLLFVITSVGLGIVMGLDSVLPQAVGAGELGEARRLRDAGVRLAIVVGLAATVLVLATPFALDRIGADPDVAHEARVYIIARAIGVAPFLLTVALRGYLAAIGRTRALIVAMIAGNIVNATGDVALIFGVRALGIPPLGVIGAAAATSAVQVITVLVFVAAVRGADAREPPHSPSTRADMRAIARHGLPVGGQLLAEVGIFSVATVLAAHLGELPSAAHGIALTVVSFTFAVALGVASATTVRVGHAIGAGDPSLARRRGFVGGAVGMSAMGAFAIALVAIPAPIARIFTDNPRVVAAAVPLLRIAALFQLFDGAQTIGAGALRAVGESSTTFIANIVGHYAIGLPIALVAAVSAELGAAGLWWGLCAGLTVTALILFQRFVAKTRIKSTSQSPR